jgi:hypothetical protein
VFWALAEVRGEVINKTRGIMSISAPALTGCGVNELPIASHKFFDGIKPAVDPKMMIGPFLGDRIGKAAHPGFEGQPAEIQVFARELVPSGMRLDHPLRQRSCF